jgi:hypothetical protein
MKSSATETRRGGDSTFHMPPSSALFSLVASFVFALIVMLVLLVISAR